MRLIASSYCGGTAALLRVSFPTRAIHGMGVPQIGSGYWAFLVVCHAGGGGQVVQVDTPTRIPEDVDVEHLTPSALETWFGGSLHPSRSVFIANACRMRVEWTNPQLIEQAEADGYDMFTVCPLHRILQRKPTMVSRWRSLPPASMCGVAVPRHQYTHAIFSAFHHQNEYLADLLHPTLYQSRERPPMPYLEACLFSNCLSKNRLGKCSGKQHCRREKTHGREKIIMDS